MQGRISKMLAGLVLAGVVGGISGLATPASAQEPPHMYKKYPIILTAGFAEFDPYLVPLQQRLDEGGIYDVTIYSLPWFGTQDLNDAAKGLKTHVETVRARYEGRPVDIVAFGSGGLVARSYIKNYGGLDVVDDLVMLGTPHKGTLVADAASVLSFRTCFFLPACAELMTTSPFITEINSGDTSLGNVHYTNIVTAYDELVVPHTNAFMDTSHGNIKNLTIQDQCPTRIVENLGLALDGMVYSGIEDALAKRNIEFDCGAL